MLFQCCWGSGYYGQVTQVGSGLLGSGWTYYDTYSSLRQIDG